MSDASGIQTFKSMLKKKQVLVRGIVLHAGKATPLDENIFALPWGWMVRD